jgi:hypothetical protein
LLSIAAGTTVWATPPAVTANRCVTVCLETGADGWIRSTATPIASRIFASIGVRINWGPGTAACLSKPGAIAVHLSYATPPTQAQHALAFARPYGGSESTRLLNSFKCTQNRAASPEQRIQLKTYASAGVYLVGAVHARSWDRR